jgi:hypothetical protein
MCDTDRLRRPVTQAAARSIPRKTSSLQGHGMMPFLPSHPHCSFDSFYVFRHSVYVGQVDYATTPEELLAHFEACGTVERVTIVCDKLTGRPKGVKHETE